MTKQKKAKAKGVLKAGAIQGASIIRAAGSQDGPMNFERRPAEKRVLVMAEPYRFRDESGKTHKARQVAVWPASVASKQAPRRVGLVECRETGEVFYLWSYNTKREDNTYAPKVWDLAPELLVEVFARQEQNAQAAEDMPAELREAMAEQKGA